MDERYIKSCREEFWQKVFSIELEYLVERLEGCRDILSVGCGPAVIEGGLAERGFKVTGLDISQEALSCAPDKVRIIVARAENMSFPENSFDAVIYVASLQFIDDWRKALEKSVAALRPHGRIVVMLLNPASAFFKKKFRDPASYVSKIKHTNLKEVENTLVKNFEVCTEYALRVEGNEVFKSANENDAVLRIVSGIKRMSREEE